MNKWFLIPILALSACQTPPAPLPVTVVAQSGPAAAEELRLQAEFSARLEAQIASQLELAQRASAAVYGASDANGRNPPGLAKEATETQLAEAASALPAVTPEEKLKKERENARILAGELVAVRAEMGQTVSENRKLQLNLEVASKASAELEARLAAAAAEAARERAGAAEALQKRVDELNRRADDERIAKEKALDEANTRAMRQQALWLNIAGATFLTVFGAAVAFGGIAGLRSFWIFGVLGLFAFGLAQLITQAWFMWAVGGAALISLGLGGWWVWRKYKQDELLAVVQAQKEKLGRVLDSTVPALDKLYENADQALRDTLDNELFTPLGNKMDKSDKAALHEIRADLATK